MLRYCTKLLTLEDVDEAQAFIQSYLFFGAIYYLGINNEIIHQIVCIL